MLVWITSTQASSLVGYSTPPVPFLQREKEPPLGFGYQWYLRNAITYVTQTPCHMLLVGDWAYLLAGAFDRLHVQLLLA